MTEPDLALILPLTQSGARHLVQLLSVGARDQSRAVTIYKLPGASANVLSSLAIAGFTGAKHRTLGRNNRVMTYWLTNAGARRAQKERQLQINARAKQRRKAVRRG